MRVMNRSLISSEPERPFFVISAEITTIPVGVFLFILSSRYILCKFTFFLFSSIVSFHIFFNIPVNFSIYYIAVAIEPVPPISYVFEFLYSPDSPSVSIFCAVLLLSCCLDLALLTSVFATV